MGSSQKPQWAVGKNGDTSKNIITDAPKTLKEATKYLYFEEIPTSSSSSSASSNAATIGKVAAPAKKMEAKKVEETLKAKETPKDARAEQLGAKASATSPKVAVQVSSSSSSSPPTFMEGVGAKFQEFYAAAEPHRTAILAGVAVAGIVAAAVLLQSRRSRRQKTRTVLHTDEFAPLLVAGKTPAGGYGAR